MDTNNWRDLGPIADFLRAPVTEVVIDRGKLAISQVDGKFGVVSGVCNHAGGPLGQGQLDGDYLVCPWHHWKFHRVTGKGEPGFEDDAVPSY
jgi:nitrite reductase/ring-hydroxylating ferredoxin subunit